MFRALLLANRHDLADVRLADALDDRARFRRFCGFAASDPAPELTAFVRFRAALGGCGLDRILFTAVTSQLAERGVVVRTVTLVDATMIPSTSQKRDNEARWAGQEAGLTRSFEITGADVHDAAELEAILPDAPGPNYGDSAYQGTKPERIIRARGGIPRVVHTSTWGGADALRWLKGKRALSAAAVAG